MNVREAILYLESAIESESEASNEFLLSANICIQQPDDPDCCSHGNSVMKKMLIQADLVVMSC